MPNRSTSALSPSMRRYGAKISDTAQSLDNLALLYDAQGKYAEAEPLFKRALAIYEKALGKDHPHVVAASRNYAALLREMKHENEKTKFEARAKKTHDKAKVREKE
jgi:tetratricopeptide (TPR) repeat protein